MSVSTKTLRALVDLGIGPETHHATIKKAFRKVEGWDPNKAEIQEIRAALVVGLDDEEPQGSEQTGPIPPAKSKRAKKAKATKAPAKAPAATQEILEIARGMSGRAEILKVTEATAKGRPARVVIQCADPQTTSAGESVCEGEREIAIQDAFQVYRCESCQKRAKQLYRNHLARLRRERAATPKATKATRKAPKVTAAPKATRKATQPTRKAAKTRKAK